MGLASVIRQWTAAGWIPSRAPGEGLSLAVWLLPLRDFAQHEPAA